MRGATQSAEIGSRALAASGARVDVSRVQSARDLRDFVALPEQIYARDPLWVGKDRASARREMSAKGNPFLRGAFFEHFVARDPLGKCVGRVAAVIDPAHVRRHGSKAFFGQFECVDDPRVAASLLASVEAWACERGVRIVQGPCTYAMTQDAGLQVGGFEHASVALHCYNPPYYVDLLERAGYEPAFHMSTFLVERDSEAVRRTLPRGDQALARLGLHARTIDMSRFDQELEGIRMAYNRAFVAHPETAEISRDVFAGQARELRAIVNPGLIRIIEKEGDPIGFAVAIPNANEVLSLTRGKLTPGLLLRFRKLLARVRSTVVIMVGADPAALTRLDIGPAAATGIGSVLAAQLAHGLCGNNYEVAHTTWVHDQNWRAQALMRAVGGKPLKRYAIVQKICG